MDVKSVCFASLRRRPIHSLAKMTRTISIIIFFCKKTIQLQINDGRDSSYPQKGRQDRQEAKGSTNSPDHQRHGHNSHQNPQGTWWFITSGHQEVHRRQLQSRCGQTRTIHQEVSEVSCHQRSSDPDQRQGCQRIFQAVCCQESREASQESKETSSKESEEGS